MLLTAVLLCLAQAPEPVKIAVPGLSLSGLEVGLGEAYVERFATLLGRDRRLKVTTRRDIEQILGMERQKSLLGCTEGASNCLAELAGGLGVDALISGSLAKTGSSYTVTMRVVRSTDGAEVASISERLKDEDALGEWLEAEAPRLAEKIAVAFGRSGTVSSPVVRWIPAFVGVGLLAAGVGMQVGARGDAKRLQEGTVPLGETSDVVASGRTLEAASWVFISVGAAAVAASVTWAIVGGAADSPKVAVIPMQGGAFVSIGGVLP